jgi:hypothetical protein
MDAADQYQTVRLSIGAAVIVLLILGTLLLGWQRVEATDCDVASVAACEPVGVPEIVPQARPLQG